MASSIAASTSGGGGLISTADASGNLNLVSGTTTIVAMTSAGIAVTGTLSASGAVTLTTVLPVASGGTGVATSTGSGANVLGTSPTLATPTFDSAQLATVSGTAPLYMARAWVNFNGTGTVAIRSSANVSSITDNGTGDYTVNFTTAMSDANYAASGTAMKTVGTGDVSNMRVICPNEAASAVAAGSFRLKTHYANAAVEDAAYITVMFVR